MREEAGVLEQAAGLGQRVARFRLGRSRVRDYRLNYRESRTASLGIHDSRRGGVYAPLALNQQIRASLFLAWSDGQVSRVSLDGNAEGDLEAVLATAHGIRYHDPDACHFPARARVLATPLHDPAVDRVLDGRFGILYELVDRIHAGGRALAVKRITGSVRAASGRGAILTSRGLRHEAAFSEFGFGFSFDAEVGESRSWRRPLRRRVLERAIARAGTMLASMRRRVRRARSGAQPLLLMPDFTEELVETYLLSNLDGAAIAQGRSAFRAEEFRSRRRVFRADLTLRMDPAVPWSMGSYRITAEGLAARPVTYVGSGRLLRPVLGTKYAKRLRMPASTPPNGMESVFLEARGACSFARALAAMGEGLVVLTALGLHTQDPVRGDYSLTAPHALVVGSGALRGSRKAVIAGNFFEHLRDEATRLVRVPGYRFPGLLVRAHATL